jgi:hypothetical protein
MRIRGSDQTRINITINGIPVNDAESQQVYFVNTPDLASSANGIQIQRGVGCFYQWGRGFWRIRQYPKWMISLKSHLASLSLLNLGRSTRGEHTMRGGSWLDQK